MEEQDVLANIIGKNITRLRKMANMTQLELAEKLNYSDKSVSKWEQGNGIPDVRILVQISKLFSVSLDDLVRERPEKKLLPEQWRRIKRAVTLLCSVGLCWLVAVVAYVLMGIFAPSLPHIWLAFLYGVPASAVVVLVFSCVWQWKWMRVVSLSVLIWTVIACVYLTAVKCVPTAPNLWLLFLIGIPLQLLALFFFVWKRRPHVRP